MNNIQLSNTYAANNGNLTKTTYGNGAYIENVYDVLDRIVQIKYNGSIKYKYAYNGNGDFTSLNLCAYCGNNPVARSDSEGEFWHILAGAAVGALSSFVASVATQCITKKGEIDWNSAKETVGISFLTEGTKQIAKVIP